MKSYRPGRDDAAQPRKRRRIVYDAVTLSEHDGVRYLHFGTEWVQGAMLLKKPDYPALEYAQQMMAFMLFIDQPQHVVQLGLGAAALTKFCYRHFPAARVTAVDLNPEVISVAHSMFRLPPDDERLQVVEADAMAWVEDEAHHGQVNVMQVDLYDATARGPVLDSLEFYQACRACLTAPGMLTVNLFGEHASFARNMKTLEAAFEGRVLALPEVHQGNRIALAFNGAPLEVELAELYRRADLISESARFITRKWVDGLRAVGGRRIVGSRLML